MPTLIVDTMRRLAVLLELVLQRGGGGSGTTYRDERCTLGRRVAETLNSFGLPSNTYNTTSYTYYYYYTMLNT
eukprot:COSAG06_NODE_2200_length_7363_cov_78.787996_1_plen_72_part_10